MSSLVNKNIYYVSNLGTNTISIINGEDFRLISKIELSLRSCDIDIDNKNNVYIATDRDEKIFIINHLSKSKKTVKIPNNGHFKVDSLLDRIYVSNTDELCIYSLDSFELISKIDKFSAIDCIQISNDGSKIFIIDIIQNEVQVYDSISLNLIKKYSDICTCPNDIIISEDNKYMYISDIGIKNGRYYSNILKVDLYSDKIIYIELPEGSKITYLEKYSDYIYAINKGLGRIDIIKNNLIKSIETTFKYPQKMKISKNKKHLLVTSIDSKGKGALDLINLEINKVENTFYFDENNAVPYDIGIIEEDTYVDEKIKLTYYDKNKDNDNEKETIILAKKILSSYKEKIIFQQEMIEINSIEKIKIENIDFDKCIIIDESKMRDYIEDNNEYIIFSFEFNIPYYIKCTNIKNEKIIFKGNLNGKQKATLYISDNESFNELEFSIKSSSNLISEPYIKENFIVFDVISIIETYLTKEELIYLPSSNINLN